MAVEAEGRGVGRELLAAAEDWAREQGYATLTLEVFAGNERARSVYAAAGFEEDSLMLAEAAGRRRLTGYAAAARRGRSRSSPLQLGHSPSSSAQAVQNVHS